MPRKNVVAEQTDADLIDAAIAANTKAEMSDNCDESPAALLLSAIRAHGTAGSNLEFGVREQLRFFAENHGEGRQDDTVPLPPPPPPPTALQPSPNDGSGKADVGAKEADEDGEDGRRSAASKRKPRGDTPLHAACCGGHPGVVKQLIESGANINSWSNSDGNSPAMRAIEGGNGKTVERQLQCVRLLVEAGCDMQQANYAGHTLLHVALEYKADAICDYLIKMGAKGCVIQGRKCRKCEMGIKLRSRAIAKLQQQPATSSKEDTAMVLEEEFGGDDGDFEKALESAKLDIGSRSSEMRRESGMR
jgi:hypothetical protein|eukprot:jgi/Chrpa1/5302/Chrysochromulina_OHIO_Genome00019790-RA